ncbi:MAG: cytochrome c maturation protein CcmE [Planctomycetes bacterium]|nr:cytochrome c maturation protein CcmE [Planctomycetota bacterium]
MRIWVPILLIAAGLATLIIFGVLHGSVPELQVRELLAEKPVGREIKLHGIIERIHSEVRPLRFTIRDKTDPAILCEVEVDDFRPDIFKVKTDVAVRGVYLPEQGLLRADWISTKCPSKYEASQELGGPTESGQ